MFPIKIECINTLQTLIFRTFFTFYHLTGCPWGAQIWYALWPPLLKILAFSETLGYIFVALFAVELLFSIHIRLTLDTELVDGGSELF